MISAARARAALLDLWPVLLTLVLCWPLFSGAGLPLARDLVFVPDMPLTDAAVGLGDTAPRAVPLDAVVALADSGVGGALLARLLVPLGLLLAGWGAHRLVRDLGWTARLMVAGLAVWNPFVVERLALGQWALLIAYGALPWIVLAAHRTTACVWIGLASLTPTGGLLATLTALSSAPRGERLRTLLACVVLQAPWVVPAVVGTGLRPSDPAGIAAFAPGGEGPGGAVVAMLGWGGIWDVNSVPGSRSWAALLTAVLVVAALVWVLISSQRRTVAMPWVPAAAVGAVLAVLPLVPAGRDLLEMMVDDVPGAGLLRDAHKFLAPFVWLGVVCVAVAVQRIVEATRRRADDAVLIVAGALVMLPLLLLPDAQSSTWDTVDPVQYPDGFDAVAAELADKPGDLAVLPWRSYRQFSWGSGGTSSDPAVRWFDRPVLVSDALQVSDTLVAGESERAAAIGRALNRAEGDVATALENQRVRWVLVYRDDPGLPDLDLRGLRRVYGDDDLVLYQMPGPAPRPLGEEAAQAAERRQINVWVADGVAGALWVLCLLAVLRRAPHSLRRKGSERG